MKALISNRWRRMIAVPLSVLLMGTGLLFSATASAQTIVGTAHDFSDVADTWNTTGEICVVCHTPHNAYEVGEGGGAGTRGPLWNRRLSAVTAYATYSGANRVGSFLEADPNGTPVNASGVSKLCLSCHDGTIALDSFGRTNTGAVNMGSATGNTIQDVRPNANIGEGSGTTGDLSDDHPVAFTFPTTDAEIYAFSAGFVSAGPNPGVLPLFGGTQDQLECATCHDVHGSGNNYLLRVDNNGSGLCLSCHSK